jgi:16S rRNA C967 or C1407 C5-methylase (RsmB/RsmF family)
MNWVFVDAPCTGTGTLRRNPDMKWKYSDAMLNRLVLEQREIFKNALLYLTPKGRIVYATCSVLAEENEQQVEYFLSHYPVELTGESLKTAPSTDGPDGFFATVFKRRV